MARTPNGAPSTNPDELAHYCAAGLGGPACTAGGVRLAEVNAALQRRATHHAIVKMGPNRDQVVNRKKTRNTGARADRRHQASPVPARFAEPLTKRVPRDDSRLRALHAGRR